MILYEFICQKCKTRFSEFYRLAEMPQERACINEDCDGTAHKIISLPSKPQFKGSGFYETDYKKGK